MANANLMQNVLTYCKKDLEEAIKMASNVSLALWRKKSEERLRATAVHMAYMICQNDLSFKTVQNETSPA